MKKILLFTFFLILCGFLSAQTTAVIADWDNVDLAPGAAFGNGSQDGVNFPVVENPNKSGINESDSVQTFIKPVDAASWAGFTFTLPEPIDLTGGHGTVCVDVFSDHQFLLRAKIQEDGNVEPKASFDLVYTKTGEWQQLCYDLLGQDIDGIADSEGIMYGKLVLFPDFGTVPDTESTYFFDNITKTTGGGFPPPLSVIADWDNVDLTPGAAFGNGAQDGVNFPVVENPNKSGINESDSVQTFIKPVDAASWAGFTFTLPEPIDLTGAFGKVCVDVLSDHQFKLRAKIQEDGNVEPKASFDLVYTKPGEWQQLCYDLLGQDVDGVADSEGVMYGKLVLFPDFGTVPETESTYFFDNITKTTGGGAPKGEIITDYETPETTIDMAVSFGNGHYGSDVFPIVDNPSPDATNMTSKVQEWCKANDAATWGGWFFDVDTLDFTGDMATVCMYILTDHEANIRLKVEGSETGPDISFDQMYTTPGQWQQLCYDFTQPNDNGDVAQGNIYSRLTFFPDFGVIPAEDVCFYIDEIYEQTNGFGEVRELIGDLIANSPDHTMFTEMLNTTDLWGFVNSSGVTVFAPTDDALNALPADELSDLENNIDNKLFDFVLHHVTKDSITTERMAMDATFIAQNGQDMTVTAANSEMDDGHIYEGDILAINGILHLMDTPMILPDDGDERVSLTFEDPSEHGGWTAFAGAAVEEVDNPNPSGINTSARCAKYTKSTGGQFWQGAFVYVARNINFRRQMQEICMDMLTDHEGFQRFKLEQPICPSERTSHTYISSLTVPNEWTTICADVSQISITADGDPEEAAYTQIYPQITFFPDFPVEGGTTPDNPTDFYFDNIKVRKTGVYTNDLDKLENFSMFPNPTHDYFIITTDSKVGRAIIYNASGVKMNDLSNPLGRKIDISKLPNGIYFMGLLTKDSEYLGTAKFIKQ